MRNSVLVFCILAVSLAVIQAAPAPPTRSPNPQVNLLTQGLKDKLCKRDQQLKMNGGSPGSTSSTSTTTTSSTTVKPTPKGRRGSFSRRSRQATDGPSCNTYNHYTFAQLIEENKKLLRPVNRSN